MTQRKCSAPKPMWRAGAIKAMLSAAPPNAAELRQQHLEWLSMGKPGGWGETRPLTDEEREELNMAILNGEFLGRAA